MKNGERTIQKITKHGSKNTLIHSIYGTNYWIISEKTTDKIWKISLQNPTKNVTYNLGTTTNKEHKKVWSTLTAYESEKTTKSQLIIAEELKILIKNQKAQKRGYFKEKIPNSQCYLIGEQNANKTWKMWVKKKNQKKKKLVTKENITTKEVITTTQIITGNTNITYNHTIKNIILLIKQLTKPRAKKH